MFLSLIGDTESKTQYTPNRNENIVWEGHQSTLDCGVTLCTWLQTEVVVEKGLLKIGSERIKRELKQGLQ